MTSNQTVITGATGALGSGLVRSLLARNFELHLPIVEAELPTWLEWRNHSRVHVAPNVSLDDEAQVTAFYAALPNLWASVHLVGGFAAAPIAATSLADFEQQWRINTVTCFLACREAVKAIRRTGAGGRILNVAARPVVTPVADMVSYTASKAGVAAITQSLAAEVVGENILVNAIVPSIIDTAANRKAMPNADHDRWPKPAEIAEVIALLTSPYNAVTSGALVPVYGRA